MKKLIVFSVIFALIAGSVFAVDLGGEVIGTYNLVQGSSADDTDPTTGGEMNRIRLQGDGENGDGTFGGWIRFETDTGSPNATGGNVWWKPIDQLLIRLGSNDGDGFWGKEGVTGWMFHQRANDTGVVNGDNAWGWQDYTWPQMVDWSDGGIIYFRKAFFGGYGDEELALEIKPVDMIGINIALPFGPNLTKDVFLNMLGQVDVNLDFGNIALTVDLHGKDAGDNINGNLYFYFGLGAIDNIDIDVGFGMPFGGGDRKNPMAFGLGAKIGLSDEFAIKLRTVATFGGEKEDPFCLLFDVQPQFALSDNFKVLADIGLGMVSPDQGDATIGWHLNPYVWVGEEWGPSFWAGVKLWSQGKYGGSDKAIVNWAIPIAIGVSF